MKQLWNRYTEWCNSSYSPLADFCEIATSALVILVIDGGAITLGTYLSILCFHHFWLVVAGILTIIFASIIIGIVYVSWQLITGAYSSY